MTTSTLTKSQTKKFGPKPIEGYGSGAQMTVTVRWDDECGNVHNTFAITAEVRRPGRRDIEACGCMHEDIAKVFPELAHLVKWHLFDSTAPLHYIANTVYHVRENGPTHAWVYFKGQCDPKGIGGNEERLLGYVLASKAREVVGVEGYRIKWDDKTAKARNLNAARSSACWPEATDEELTAPGLEDRLRARLPALMERFRADVESLGFTW